MFTVKSRTLTEKARGNLLHTKLNNADLLLSDSRKLCLRDKMVDSIVSGIKKKKKKGIYIFIHSFLKKDWPWGLRENSYQQIQGVSIQQDM